MTLLDHSVYNNNNNNNNNNILLFITMKNHDGGSVAIFFFPLHTTSFNNLLITKVPLYEMT